MHTESTRPQISGRTDQATSPPSQPPLNAIRRKAILGAACGHVVEWYDFAIYGYLAIYIGGSFFPSEDPATQLLSAFAVFGISFFARPLGGVVLGPLADRLGRKRIMVMVVSTMSLSTVLIGVMPTFEQIGILAPLTLVVLRLIQGFSAGGEVGNANAFAAEYSEDNRRGLSVSWMAFSSVAGIMIGGILATGLSASLPSDSMGSWGWRIPFLISAPLGIIGLYIRMKLEDTPKFVTEAGTKHRNDNPLREILNHKRSLVLTFGIATMYSVSFYMVFTYMNTYIRVVANMPTEVALIAGLSASVTALIVIPIAGYTSDLAGRKPVLLTSAILFLLFSYPLFSWINTGSTSSAIIGTTLLAAMQAIFLATSMITMTELFEVRVRVTGLSIGINIPAAIFGGMAPFVATYLIKITGNPVSPALYLIGAAAIATVALVSIKSSDLTRDARE